MSKKKSKNMKEVVKLLVFVAIVVGVILGVNIALQIALGTSIPTVVVTSGSMIPTINIGDVCIIQRVAADQYVVGNHANRTGDIIVYNATGLLQGAWSGGEPIIHRIISRTFDNATGHYSFLVQGDNNPSPDPDWVQDTRVYGKVISTIPWVGNIFLFLRGGGAWILVAALAVIIVYVLISETSKIDKKVKEKVKPDRGSAVSHATVRWVSRT